MNSPGNAPTSPLTHLVLLTFNLIPNRSHHSFRDYATVTLMPKDGTTNVHGLKEVYLSKLLELASVGSLGNTEAVMGIVFKIKSNPMHPLSSALHLLSVPAHIACDAMVAHKTVIYTSSL